MTIDPKPSTMMGNLRKAIDEATSPETEPPEGDSVEASRDRFLATVANLISSIDFTSLSDDERTKFLAISRSNASAIDKLEALQEWLRRYEI